MKSLSYLFLGWFICFSVQANQQAEVKQVAQHFFNAVKSFDSESVANMLHPEALAKFKGTFSEALHGPKSEQAKQELLPFFSVSSIAQFDALTDKEAYLRFSNFMSSQPQLLIMLQAARFIYQGALVSGDVATVNYTLSMGIQGQSIDRASVQKFKLYKGQWLALLPPDGEASIAGVKARYN